MKFQGTKLGNNYYSLSIAIRRRLGQQHGLQSITFNFYFLYKYLLESYIYTFLWK
jgi:hypothetical protein